MRGLFFDRIPLVSKLKLRLVTTGRIMYGTVSERHNQVMLMPSFVKKFGNIPYSELAYDAQHTRNKSIGCPSSFFLQFLVL